MAMIKCRECGKEISSRAECCPFCGAKTRFGMNEEEKKQMSTAAVVLLIISVVGTILFVSGFVTMMGDISDYHNSWYGGYNYKSPLTEHELSVVMRMFFGAVLDIGCSVAAYTTNKKK